MHFGSLFPETKGGYRFDGIFVLNIPNFLNNCQQLNIWISHPKKYLSVGPTAENPRLFRVESYRLHALPLFLSVTFQHFQRQNNCVAQGLVIDLEVEDVDSPIIAGRTHEWIALVEARARHSLLMILHRFKWLRAQVQVIAKQLK